MTANGFIEVDGIEVVSLVDNVVDFLSPINHRCACGYRQWTREQLSGLSQQMPVAEHGFSMLIRTFKNQKCHSILFDAGSNTDTVCVNAKRMGIDLSEVKAVVLPHGHYDHFGGLCAALKVINNPALPIIVHESIFKTRGSATSKGAIRRYPDFPPQTMLKPGQVVHTKQLYCIADGTVCVTGEIPPRVQF